MNLDSRSGDWSGTPTTPGNYWVQILVQKQAGMAARIHNFTWTVTGEDLSEQESTLPAISDDTNTEIAFVPELSEEQITDLQESATQAGVALVIQNGTPVMLLAPAEQRERARKVIQAFFGGKHMPDGFSWEQ